MANVLFKRGTQSSLNTLKASGIYQEGTFYLTTDTDRLYFAQSNNELVDLNQYIKTVPTIEDLPETDVEAGDFYYIEGKNILCIRNKTNDGWTQINPDTTIVKNDQNVVLDNTVTNKVTVTSTVTDSKDNKSKGAFTVAGGGVISVTKNAAGEILISAEKGVDTTYTFNSGDYTSDTGNGAKVVLTSEVGDKKAQEVAIVGTGVTTVSKNTDGEIVVHTKAAELDIDEFAFDANGALNLKITSDQGAEATLSCAPEIVIGVDKDDKFAFVSGSATLPVYTMEETDAKIAEALQTADAMTFQGVADEFPPTADKVNKGDTYKANFTNRDLNIFPGDLIISQSVDGTLGANVDWAVIPSANDQVISGAKLTNGIKVADQNGTLVGIQIGTEDASLAVTESYDSATKVNTVKVTHAAPLAGAAVTVAGEKVVQSTATKLTIPVVDGISKDKNGHITDVSYTNYEVTDTHVNITGNPFDLEVSGDQVAGTKHTATVGLQILTSDGNTAKKTFAFESDSLVMKEVADADGNVKASVDLVWGSF